MNELNQLKELLLLLESTVGMPSNINPYYSTLNSIDKTEEGGQIIMSADLDADGYQEYFESLFDDNHLIKNIWNESLKNLWQLIADSQSFSESSPNLRDNGTANPNGSIISHKLYGNKITFNSKDNIYGDAGNSFEKNGKWVRPWYNNSGLAANQFVYSVIRGTDIVKKLIQDFSCLDFTNPSHVYPYPQYGEEPVDTEELIGYLRLLLPRNTRRVIIEDLNRNFWVIGQCISMMCAYLFGDDSYFKNIFKGALSEITQLWENVLYLWVLFSLNQLKHKLHYHVEMVPLQNNILEPYNKYDNFEIDTDWNNFIKNYTDEDYIDTIDEIKKRLNYYRKKYPNSSLILFPYARARNYQQNYYSTMYLLGVYFYDAIRNEESFRPFLSKNYENELAPATIKTENFTPYLYAARETELGYRYCCPFSNSLTVGTQNQKFFCALRPTINIDSITYDYLNNRKRIVLNNVTFNFFDGVKNIVSAGQDSIICSYNIDKIEETDTCSAVELEFVQIVTQVEDIALTYTDPRPKHGYYLGELISYAMIGQGVNCVITEHIPYATTGKLIKIANFLPKDFLNNESEQWSDNDIIHEQVVNTQDEHQQNIKTDYIYNLAIGGMEKGDAGIARVKQIFKSDRLGAEATLDSSKCNLYIPIEIKTENDFKYSYQKYDGNSQEVGPEIIKGIGINTVKQYIENHFDELNENEMIYFMGACGAFPWHNTTANSGQLFESYWTINIMTHMFRFVPEIFKDSLTPEQIAEAEIIEIDDEEIGLLQVLGDLNFQETFTRFLKNDYSGYINYSSPYRTVTGKWRLPQLLPDNSISNILCVEEQITQSYFYLFIESPTCPQEIKDAYAIYKQSGEQNATELINLLNINFATYRDSGCLLSEQEAINEAVQSPSGIWAIFDGYENGTNPNYINSSQNNIEYYKNNPESPYKEVARITFNYDLDNGFSFSNAQQRDLNHSNWRDDHIINEGLNGIIIPFNAILNDSNPNKNTVKLNNGYYEWYY